MSRQQIDVLLNNCIYGSVKFLYLSPERLHTELFVERVKQMNVGLIAVDEAHCISQWGYDFRPSYLKIASLRALKPDVPVMALTATATVEVRDDIVEKLEFKKPAAVFQKSFARDNLSFVVRKTENKEKEGVGDPSKSKWLCHYLCAFKKSNAGDCWMALQKKDHSVILSCRTWILMNALSGRTIGFKTKPGYRGYQCLWYGH